MKKTAVLALCLCLLFSSLLCACAGAAPSAAPGTEGGGPYPPAPEEESNSSAPAQSASGENPEASLPTVDGNAARIPGLGLRFCFPEPWAPLSPEEVSAVLDGIPNQDIPGAGEVTAEELEEMKKRVLLFIQPETGDLVQFTVSAREEGQGFAAYVRETPYDKLSGVLTGLSEIKELTLAGVDFCTFTGEYAEAGMLQRYWYGEKDGQMLQITCSAQDSLGEMEDIVFAAESIQE